MEDNGELTTNGFTDTSVLPQRHDDMRYADTYWLFYPLL